MGDGAPVSVILTTIITAGIVLLSLIAGIVYLSNTGHGTEALTNFFSAGNTIGIIYAIARIRGVERNTNHNQDKLIDAAIQSPPPGR